MKQLLNLSLSIILLCMVSCTPEEDLLFPEFSYTIDGETVSNDNYDQEFSTAFEIFQICLDQDDHSLNIQIMDYAGLGVYDPSVIRYQLGEGKTYYAQEIKEVEITLVEDTYIEGHFSASVEEIFGTEKKDVSGTFRVKIK